MMKTGFKNMLFGMLVVIQPTNIYRTDLIPSRSFVMRNPWMVQPDTIIVREDKNFFRITSSEFQDLKYFKGEKHEVETLLFREMNSFGFPYTSGPCFLVIPPEKHKLLDEWIKLPMDGKSIVVVEEDYDFEECFEMKRSGACNRYEVYFYRKNYPWLILTHKPVPGTEPFINVRPTRIVNWKFEYAKDMVMKKINDFLKEREKDLIFSCKAYEEGTVLDSYMYRINRAKMPFAPRR